MTDGVIKSTGNSRYLKSVANFLTLYPTYEEFAAALVAGNLPIDLNGINPDGWNQQGTPLNKANLLADATGSMLGLGSTGTVNAALKALKTSLNAFPPASVVSIIDTGAVTSSGYYATLYTSGTPKAAILVNRKQPTYSSLTIAIVGGVTLCLRYNSSSSSGGSLYIDGDSSAPIVSGSLIQVKVGSTNENSFYYFVLGRK